MLPHLLTSRLKNILGEDFDSVMNAFSHAREGTFRLNTLKSPHDEVFGELREKNITLRPFSELPGVYSFSRDDEYALKGTKAFYEGKIYLQSLASLLPVLALDPKERSTILDVCAAPGSKTTQLAAMTHNTAHITALEQNQIRYDKLLYNCRLQGAVSVVGKKCDARNYLSSTDDTFDAILLDAPCSAEGRISLANEKTYGFWSLDNIEKKADLQYELLSLAVGRLKKGGILVYSTCTLAPEENEGVVSRVLRENPELSLETIDIGLSQKPWWREGITKFADTEYHPDMKKAVRILPSAETEGFFVAKIVKASL